MNFVESESLLNKLRVKVIVTFGIVSCVNDLLSIYLFLRQLLICTGQYCHILNFYRYMYYLHSRIQSLRHIYLKKLKTFFN